MAPSKILAFAGSTRRDSYNKKVLRVAVRGARSAGATVTEIDLADYPLPLYDGDLEARDGLPANGRRLKDLFLAHQALLIASPEYNSSISGVLKNAIDWVSRPVQGQPPLAEFDGKVAALLSASTGALGGLRGLVHVRAILGNIKVLVIPDQVAVMKANEALGPDGEPKDPQQKAALESLGAKLATVTSRLSLRPSVP
jgi:NAD(P)H-dependent FMN reductase